MSNSITEPRPSNWVGPWPPTPPKRNTLGETPEPRFAIRDKVIVEGIGECQIISFDRPNDEILVGPRGTLGCLRVSRSLVKHKPTEAELLGDRILARLGELEEKLNLALAFSNVPIDLSSFRAGDNVVLHGNLMEVDSFRCTFDSNGRPISATLEITKPKT